MKFTSKMLATVIALAVLATASVAALAEYGSGAVTGGQTYTTEQMLTYAIQDEYMALAEYQAIVAKFGASRPFTNIIPAEQYHISLLAPLFETYGVKLPENDPAGRVTVPETLELAYAEGVKAETSNIAMYEAFLSQELPDDVKAVFTALKAASENHLKAFEQNASRAGNARLNNAVGAGGRGRNGTGRGDTSDDTRGNGGRNARADRENCLNDTAVPAA